MFEGVCFTVAYAIKNFLEARPSLLEAFEGLVHDPDDYNDHDWRFAPCALL